MGKTIYEQHEAAFSQVSAFVIMLNGERVATVAFKFPRDGAGRLYAYVHLFGSPMVRGSAGGYGYDKKSAAVSSAVGGGKITVKTDTDTATVRAFVRACAKDDGYSWQQNLEKAGFTVLQAV